MMVASIFSSSHWHSKMLLEKVQKVPKRSDLPPIGCAPIGFFQDFYGNGVALGLLPSATGEQDGCFFNNMTYVRTADTQRVERKQEMCVYVAYIPYSANMPLVPVPNISARSSSYLLSFGRMFRMNLCLSIPALLANHPTDKGSCFSL